MSYKQSFIAVAATIALTAAIAMPMPANAADATEILSEAAHAQTVAKKDIKGSTDVLAKSAGYLVFPEVYEAGVGIGGEFGEGVLMVDNQPHSYYNMASASWGFKLGAQKKAVFISFTTEDSLNEFINSKGWEIGADASIAILKAGTEGSINSTVTNKPVVAFVTDQKGLMYDVSLEGTKITRIKK